MCAKCGFLVRILTVPSLCLCIFGQEEQRKGLAAPAYACPKALCGFNLPSQTSVCDTGLWGFGPGGAGIPGTALPKVEIWRKLYLASRRQLPLLLPTPRGGTAACTLWRIARLHVTEVQDPSEWSVQGIQNHSGFPPLLRPEEPPAALLISWCRCGHRLVSPGTEAGLLLVNLLLNMFQYPEHCSEIKQFLNGV